VPCKLLLLLRTVVLEMESRKSEFESDCARPAEASRLGNKIVKNIADEGDQKDA